MGGEEDGADEIEEWLIGGESEAVIFELDESVQLIGFDDGGYFEGVELEGGDQ